MNEGPGGRGVEYEEDSREKRESKKKKDRQRPGLSLNVNKYVEFGITVVGIGVMCW